MVNDVVEKMAGITNSSHKIGEIISVIEGIAFQTNILALNAAVEARVPVKKAVASRSSRAKCVISRSAAQQPPKRSRC